MSILVVHIEDLVDWQKIIEDVLKSNFPDIKYLTTTSIEDGLNIFRKSKSPNVAVVDLRLSREPAYQGLDFLVDNAESLLRLTTEVFIVSGYVPPEIRYLLKRKGIPDENIFDKGIGWDSDKFLHRFKQVVSELKDREQKIISVKHSLASYKKGNAKPFIFVSYSHLDTDYVHKLAEEMQNVGLEIWIDDRIDYGDQWPLVIQEKLDSSHIFLVVMTSRSLRSQWVQNELSRAMRLKKPIFPLLLEGDGPWLAVEAIQWVDVRDGKLPSPRLYERIANIIST